MPRLTDLEITIENIPDPQAADAWNRLQAQKTTHNNQLAYWQGEARIHRHRADDMEDNALRTQGNLRAMKERLETAETRIKAVRELHTGTHWPGVMDKPICDECDQAMPCPTTRALNGDE